MVGIIDRVDGAVLVDAGFARREPVFLRLFELGVVGVGAVVLARPFDHVGVFGGLAVDRPGRAVIVRRRSVRFVVDVGEHLEAELGILVQDFHAARLVVAAIFGDEVGIGEQALEIAAHLFAAGRARIAGERGFAIGDELVEVVGHGRPP